MQSTRNHHIPWKFGCDALFPETYFLWSLKPEFYLTIFNASANPLMMRIQLLVTLGKIRQDVMHQMPASWGKIHMSNASNRRQDTIYQMQAWVKTENFFRKLGYPKWTLTDNASTLTLLDIFLLGLLKMTSLTPLMTSKETADGGSHQFLWTCYSCALANLGNCMQLCITARGLGPPVRGPQCILFDTTYYCFVW